MDRKVNNNLGHLEIVGQVDTEIYSREPSLVAARVMEHR